MNTQFPYDIDKTTIFPFFLIETPGKFVPLNDFEEIALLTKIFNKLKQSYLLTRFYYPFQFLKLDTGYLAFDAHKKPEFINIPQIDNISTELLANSFNFKQTFDQLSQLNSLLTEIHKIETNFMTPLPSITSKSLNTYKFHWSQELFFTSISKIPLMSVYWSNDFNNTVRINNSSLQEVIKQILPTTNQFEKILAIINKNLSIWIDQALLEENSLHQDNESQEVLEEVKNQGIDFLVAYYESIISGLKQELKELKEGIKFNNQDILSVLNMLEEPPISDVNIDDDRSPRERLLDLVSKIKSILYEYLEKLKLFNQIESYTYNIPSFTAPNYVISIPIYVLIPKNVEMKISNCKFIYPSIIAGYRKYLGEQLTDYSKISQVGKYLRSCCIVESALDPILNEARKNDFFQFRFKTSIDMGSDGLRSKRIF